MSSTRLPASTAVSHEQRQVRFEHFRHAAAESLWISGGTYAAYGAMFSIAVIINRTYGTAELGTFGMAWAAAQLTSQAAISGFSAIHRRDVAYAPGRAAELAGTTLTLRLVALTAVWVAACLGVAGMRIDAALGTAILAVMLGKSIEAIGMTFSETLQVLGQNRSYAQLSAISALVLLGIVLIGSGAGLRPAWIYAGVVGAGAASAIVAWAVFRRRVGHVCLGTSAVQARAVLGESWPLMINAVVFVAATRVSVLLVGWLSGTEAAGVYTFATGAIAALSVFAAAAGTVLFPELCSLFAKAPHLLRGRMYRVSAGLAVLGTLLALMLTVIAETLLQLFGDLPPVALDVLLTLGVGLVAAYGSVPANYMFTAIRQQREGMTFALANLALTVMLLVGLVPSHGAWGAALAVTITQSVMWLVALAWLDVRHLHAYQPDAAGHLDPSM